MLILQIIVLIRAPKKPDKTQYTRGQIHLVIEHTVSQQQPELTAHGVKNGTLQAPG